MICPVTHTRCTSSGCSVYIDGKCGLLPRTDVPPADRSGTPETDALIACHTRATAALPMMTPEGFRKHALKQVLELVSHARSLERRLIAAQPVMDMLILCGEQECWDEANKRWLEGAAKLRALIDALIEQRQRASQAESADRVSVLRVCKLFEDDAAEAGEKVAVTYLRGLQAQLRHLLSAADQTGGGG